MTLLHRSDSPDLKMSHFFLATPDPRSKGGGPLEGNALPDGTTVLELEHRWGVENEEEYKVGFLYFVKKIFISSRSWRKRINSKKIVNLTF